VHPRRNELAKGSQIIDQLLTQELLERVPANEAEAQFWITQAQQHLLTSEGIAFTDPEMAYDALYSAALKALAAVLLQQGLKPTRKGGHDVLAVAFEAQLVPPLNTVVASFQRIKRQRHSGDYAGSSAGIHGELVLTDLSEAKEIVEAATKVIPSLPVYLPGPGFRPPTGSRRIH
jgi:uncharacterized protein (UPF0332 family)